MPIVTGTASSPFAVVAKGGIGFMKNAVVFIRKCPEMGPREWEACSMGVKWGEIFGFVMKGRLDVGHSSACASMVLYL